MGNYRYRDQEPGTLKGNIRCLQRAKKEIGTRRRQEGEIGLICDNDIKRQDIQEA
jgi:hypothetical protein